MTPWAVAHQASQSMGIFWQEYWSEKKKKKNTGVGCHALLQRIILTQGSNHDSYVSCLDKLVLYHWAAREALKWLKMTPKDWHVWLFKKISLTCYFSTCWRFPGWLGLFCFQISSWEKKILQFPLVALPRFWQSLLKSVTHEEIML